MNRFIPLALTIVALAPPGFAEDKPSSPVKQNEVLLEGGPFVDLMAVDSDRGRLYVAHSPMVDVVDLTKGERVGQVEGVNRAHGIAIVAATKRGFATSGMKNKLLVFDLDTLKVTKEVDTGENPDAVLYVSATNEVWSFNGKSTNVTCVDASTLEVKATIPLEGKPELAVEDAGKGLVYLNLEDKSAVCVVDAKAHKAVSSHSVAPGEGPTGIAFDSKIERLFVGCGNKKLVVLDVTTWKAITSIDIGEHCDGVAFDDGTATLVAAGNGATTVVHEKDANSFDTLGPLETPGGRTCAVDAKTHRFYVTTGPKRGEKGAVKLLTFGPPAPAAPGDVASSWTGKLEKVGPSISMEGTHRLVGPDKTAVLLKSVKADLAKYEGKTVRVTGRSSPTVEGHLTIVDVDTVEVLP